MGYAREEVCIANVVVMPSARECTPLLDEDGELFCHVYCRKVSWLAAKVLVALGTHNAAP